jgi:hypothetical protein
MFNLKKVIYILLLLAFQANAQQYKVEAKADTSAILIGEQVKVNIKIDYRRDLGSISIVFPTIYDTINEFVEIVNKSKIDTIVPDKAAPYQVIQQQTITLTSFDSGYYVIPPFKFIINDDTVETEAFLLEVNTLPVDTAQGIFDIKQPISEPFSLIDWLKENWWWMAAILVLAILIFVLIRYLKNRKPKEVIVEEEIPVIPCHVIALEKLEKLNQEKLWQSGKVKLYHSHISEILREYIENRYQVNALEETTAEIMHGLRLQQITPEMMNKLTQTLTLADLVKFAKEQPLHQENEQSLTIAVAFINATKIVEEQVKNKIER